MTSKIALEISDEIANKPNVLAPLFLGYVVGAVGIYTLLYKLSPVVTDDYVMQASASGEVTHVEIIELFPTEDSVEHRKAA